MTPAADRRVALRDRRRGFAVVSGSEDGGRGPGVARACSLAILAMIRA